MKLEGRTLSLVVVACLLVVGLLQLRPVFGDTLPQRSIRLSQGVVGTADTYQLSFSVPAIETLGSVRLQFCAESPLMGLPCSLPSGMNLSGVTLSAQSGGGNFSIQSVSGTSIILTRTAGSVSPAAYSFTFDNIVNPSNVGSYFGRIQTYSTTDASGASTDFGGLAFALTSSVQISATVPPYLYFCLCITISNTDCTTASGDYINFGNFSANAATTGQTQMVAGTNAETGYTITVNGSTLTAGTNVIPGLATADTSRPGTGQFGINLVANQDPQVGRNPIGNGTGTAASGYNQVNLYKFVNGDVVASAGSADDARKYTTSYIANIAKAQPPGIYVSTLTYICLAGF